MTKKRRKTQNYPLVGDFNLPNLTHPMAARGVCLLWLPSHGLGGIISMTSDLPLYISPANLMSYAFNCKNPWKIRSSGSPHHSTHSHRWPCHVHSVSAPNLLNSCFSPTWWERNGPKSRCTAWNPRWKQCPKKYIQRSRPRRSGFLCGQVK